MNETWVLLVDEVVVLTGTLEEVINATVDTYRQFRWEAKRIS